MRSERGITDRLRAISQVSASPRLVLGIGDDCAIYRPRGSTEDLLFTADQFIEGVHFLRQTHKAADIGRNAMARSLSDIAAMGGTPRFCLVSLCLPKWAPKRLHDKWVDSFFDALTAAASKAGAVLAGGDLAQGETCACDVTVCGSVPRGTALRRDGARAGDSIYVSGALGGSALGLATKKGKAWERHLNPEPRLMLGKFLRKTLRAGAAIDISDGLSLDLQRICMASAVDAAITDPPRFQGASLEQALHGGEEYELLFTVRPGTRVPASFAGTALTRIGMIVKGLSGGGRIRYAGKPLAVLGYDHFGGRS